jgi:glycerol-3-phosphate dehydrogenase
MKRNVKKAETKLFDLIIIGGGISGACVAWDAALRGLTCLLLEKKDFGHATSSATSKLVHGGLRYLKNFELSLVRESLSERRFFEVIAPHLVHPIPFIVPTYGHGMDSRLPLMAALTVYDVLGYDKKDLDDPEKRIPNHTFISKEKALELEPGISPEGLSGAAVYYDCQMPNPDRLTLEFILSAHEYGAEVLNYFEVVDFLITDKRVMGVVATDTLTGTSHTFKGKVTVNVSGPWADLTLARLKGHKAEKHLVRSKGIHLVTRSLTKRHAVVLKTPSDRHFFIIPWRGCSLIGTTDTKFVGDPDKFKVTEKDITDLIAEANASYPGGNLSREDVYYFYGGLRPLVDTDTEVEVYDASRRYEITDHAKTDGFEGLLTVLGGKYTTSRRLASQIVDLVYAKLNVKSPECMTDSTQLMGGHTGNLKRFIDNSRRKCGDKVDAELTRHLIMMYGSEAKKILAKIKDNPELGKRIAPNQADVWVEIDHAIDHEMAMRLDDLIYRRTPLGTLGRLPDDVLAAVAVFAAERLGWSRERIQEETAMVIDRCTPLEEQGTEIGDASPEAEVTARPGTEASQGQT